jgi:hypothetical protein
MSDPALQAQIDAASAYDQLLVWADCLRPWLKPGVACLEELPNHA